MDKFLKRFVDVNNLLNLKLLLCFNEVFNIKNITKNYGFYIQIIIFGIFLIILFLFLIKFRAELMNKIKRLIFAKVNSEVDDANTIINNENRIIKKDNRRK